MGCSKFTSSSSSVSFRLKPLQRRRGARAAVLTAPAGPMSFPSIAASFDPLLQAQHHAIVAADEPKKKRWEEKEPLSPEKLEQWMRDSVGEIVRNIGEAPFLVHIFAGRGGGGQETGVRLEREAATPEEWPRIRKRWYDGSPRPDGVILVEELKDEEKEEEEEAERATSAAASGPKTWGLVVQGRGMDCAACYLLDTCRVRSSVGFCTHFCLVRAQCFGEPSEVQLRKAWLQGR